MLRSLRLLLLPLAVLLAAAAQAVAADDPHYVMQVQPIAKLIKTAKEFTARFEATGAGKDTDARASTEIEEQLTKLLGRGWRDAIDESKPILLYGRLTKDKNTNTPVLLLPVKSVKAAREHMKDRGIKVEESDNGCQKCELPGLNEPVYFRFAHGCLAATMGNTETLTEERLLDPGKLTDAREKAAVAAHLYIDRLPSDIVDFAIGFAKGIRESFEQGLQKSSRGGLPGPAQRTVDQWKKNMEAWGSAAVRHGKVLSLRLDLDSSTGELHTSLRLTPQPGSDLARMLSAVRSAPSLGAALIGGAPLAAVQVRLSLSDDMSSLLLDEARKSIKQAVARVEDEKAQAAYKDLTASVEPTIQQGILDTALVMHGPGKKNRYGAIFALQLKNGRAVEKALKKLVGFLPADNPLGLLRMDTDTIGDTKVHRYPLGMLVPKEVQKLFGQDPAVIAFREEGLLIAYGEGAEEHLEKALAAEMGKAPPLLIHAEGDSKGLAQIISQNDPRSAEQVKRLADSVGDRLHLLHLSLAGGDALHIRAAANLLLMPRAASAKAPAGSKPPASGPSPPPAPLAPCK